jgi:hypothetical protein
VRVLPAALLAGVCAATLISPRPLDIGFVLGAIPPLAVLSYGPAGTAVLGGLALAVLHVPAFRLDDPGSTDLLTFPWPSGCRASPTGNRPRSCGRSGRTSSGTARPCRTT